MNRDQWKTLYNVSKKGGVQKFKQLMEESYTSGMNDAYERAMTQGIKDIKSVLLDAVQKTLHEEFGIGPKRFEKFNQRFTDVVEAMTVNVESTIDHKENTTIQRSQIEDSESISHIILLCMSEYVYQISRSDSKFFQDTNIKNLLDSVHNSFNEYIVQSNMRIEKQQLDSIYKIAANKVLILKDK